MLVVSRKAKQSLMIGSEIEVVILDVKDGIVKIGIEAPKGVRVLRKEIYEDIIRQNNEALMSDEAKIKEMLDKG